MTSSQTSQNSAAAADCRRVHHCRQCGQGDQLTTRVVIDPSVFLHIIVGAFSVIAGVNILF